MFNLDRLFEQHEGKYVFQTWLAVMHPINDTILLCNQMDILCVVSEMMSFIKSSKKQMSLDMRGHGIAFTA